jgi:hypothetical protein
MFQPASKIPVSQADDYCSSDDSFAALVRMKESRIGNTIG